MFDAVVQYSAVARQVVKVDTPFWRETMRKRSEANKTAAPAQVKEAQQAKEKKAAAPKEQTQGEKAAPSRARRV